MTVDKEIVKWHKKTFPDITLVGMLLKLEEEIQEFLEALHSGSETHSQEELADVYIVATVLKERFHSALGGYFKDLLYNYPKSYLEDTVKRKLKINKGRTWKTKKGVIRHEGD